MVDIIPEESKRKTPVNLDPETGKRYEPPKVPTDLTVPENILDYLIGLGINRTYHFDLVTLPVKGTPRFIRLENRAIDPYPRALIKTVTEGLGSDPREAIGITRVWFDPEVFGVLANPISKLTKKILDPRNRFRAMCMGLLSPYLQEEGEFNINVRHPNALERINYYAQRAMGQPLGKYRFVTHSQTGVVKIDDLHERIIPELLTHPEVQTLPFIGNLLRLPERMRFNRLVGPNGKLTKEGIAAFEADPNGFLGVPFIIEEISGMPQPRNGQPVKKEKPTFEDEELSLLKLHHAFTAEPELPD